MTTFSLDDAQVAKVHAWRVECGRKAVERQRANPPSGVSRDILESCWEEGQPYGGAIGGGVTYSFAPTSLGVVVMVHDAHVDETLDLTDYDAW